MLLGLGHRMVALDIGRVDVFRHTPDATQLQRSVCLRFSFSRDILLRKSEVFRRVSPLQSAAPKGCLLQHRRVLGGRIARAALDDILAPNLAADDDHVFDVVLGHALLQQLHFRLDRAVPLEGLR